MPKVFFMLARDDLQIHENLMIMTSLTVIALVVALLSLFWCLVKSASSKITFQYYKLAEHFSLDVTEGQSQLAGFIRSEPFVHGDYRGRELSISAPSKGIQNTRQTETVIKIALKNVDGFTVQMTTSGMLGSLRQRGSKQKKRWLSGNVKFDQAVDVRTSDGVRLAMHLDETGQRAITSLLDGTRATVYLGQGTLAYTELGLIAGDHQRERYERAVEILCDFAEILERN